MSVSANRSTNHVGIHARAADFLPHLVDDEQVDLGEGQPRHELASSDQKPGLFYLERFRREERQVGRIMKLVFQNRQAAEDWCSIEHEPRNLTQDALMSEPTGGSVAGGGSRLFPESDRQHLR